MALTTYSAWLSERFFKGSHERSIRRARWISISVISGGFIGITHFIAFQEAKQGSTTATIKPPAIQLALREKRSQ
jgi:hypothetical protein